jgi:hypothetical protein
MNNETTAFIKDLRKLLITHGLYIDVVDVFDKSTVVGQQVVIKNQEFDKHDWNEHCVWIEDTKLWRELVDDEVVASRLDIPHL